MMGDMERLLKDIKEAYDYDGSKFKLMETGDTFIRFSFYSDSNGETSEMEEGYTDEDEQYSGRIGIFEKYKNRSSVESRDWKSDALKTLCDKYCVQRTPFNFYTAWFYWHLTGKILDEIRENINISGNDHEFFRADPDLILPKTREAMKDRCLEMVSSIIKTHESYDEHFSGYYHGDDYDRIFDHASSCNDGTRMIGEDEVAKELMDVPPNELKGKLNRALKEAINIRLAEPKKQP